MALSTLMLIASIGTGAIAVDQLNKALDPEHESKHKSKAMFNLDSILRLTSLNLPALTLTPSRREGTLKVVSISF